MDAIAAPGISPLLVAGYHLPLTPAEYVRRNVRVTPLPAIWESPVSTVETYPEVSVIHRSLRP